MQWVEGEPTEPGCYWVYVAGMGLTVIQVERIEGLANTPRRPQDWLKYMAIGSTGFEHFADPMRRLSSYRITHHMRIPIPEHPVG